MGSTYWMIVCSADQFQTCLDYGFKVQGIGAKNRRKAQRMQPEDCIVYYVSTIQKFPAIAKVTTSLYEDDKPLWKGPNGKEQYPLRVGVDLDIMLNEDEYLDARQIAPSLEYVKRWAPEDWYLAFQGQLHILSQKDYYRVQVEMERITSK